MKHNLQNMKAVRYIGLVLLVLILALVSSRSAAATPPDDPNGNTQESQKAISSYLAAQEKPGLSDEEKIKAAIDAYFTLRYEGQKSLVTQDFSTLLEDKTLDWVKREQDKREIELYIATLFDLRYEKYTFTLDYDSIEIKNDEAVIRLRESHTVVFSALAPDESRLFNLSHTITLHYNKGAWVIYDDDYQDELSRQMGNEPVQVLLERVYDNYERMKNGTGLQEFNNDEIPSPDFIAQNDEELWISIQDVAFHEYNRTAAVQYADAWASNSEHLRNPTWGNFDNYGGDCTNYASQVIWNGAPQMDDTGSYKWYYYGYNSRAPSWTDVGALYNYLVNNSSTGPVGTDISNPCSLGAGDIIQLRDYRYTPWFHSMVVRSVSADCTSYNYKSKIACNSHSTEDRFNYPLSFAIDQPYIIARYIRIDGYWDGVPYITFVDAPPSHWAWQNIERLYSSGITSGCQTNPRKYCPESNVTRAQMAVFLEKGIHGISYNFPAPTGIFSDVPTNYWAAKWIEHLYQGGITAGCNASPLQYCPENSTTHAQMAIFTLQSKHGGSYIPPAVGNSTGFSDVPTSHWAAAWIKQAAAEGIFSSAELVSDGCAAGNFCPDTPVTRALMAGLLVRTFNLP